MTPRVQLLPAVVLMGLVSAAHLTLAPKIADADSFYHMGHAAHYAEQGLSDTAFPWATQSVISDLGADLWWGFHVVLVPFTSLGDVAWSIRVAGFVFTLILAGAVWWLFGRHRVAGPGWWTLLFLVAVPNVLYRYLMVRPHVLSLAASFLILSFLVRGRWWQVAAAAAVITWLHLGLFWMAPGVVAAYALVRLLQRLRTGSNGSGPGVPASTATGAVFLGTVLGWALRPHPFAAAELAYVQIVRLFAEKATDQPILFATELSPLPLDELLRSSWLFIVAWVAAVLLTVVHHTRTGGSPEEEASDPSPTGRPEQTLLLTATLISVTFLALSLLSARRAMVEFVAFGFVAIPLAWHALTEVTRRRATLVLSLALIAHAPWAAHRHLLNARFVAFPPDLMAEAASWLESNSEPGDIVFHAHWDNFGPLFAWNRQNHYLGGMDPIFQLAHHRGRYWEYFYLSGDLVTEYTCDAFPCRDGVATETHEAIGDHFGARWVLVEPARNPKLTTELMNHAGFELAHETRREAIFRVVDPDDSLPLSGPVG